MPLVFQETLGDVKKISLPNWSHNSPTHSPTHLPTLDPGYSYLNFLCSIKKSLEVKSSKASSPIGMPSKNKTLTKLRAKDKMEEVVRCVCGQTKNDDLPMVACDQCFVWQHMECTDYKDGPNEYLCEECAPSQHPYKQLGFKTHLEYLRGKSQPMQVHRPEQEPAVNGRRRSSVRSHSYIYSDNAYEPPLTRPSNNVRKNNNSRHIEPNSYPVKTSKRRASVSSYSEIDDGHRGNSSHSSSSKTYRKPNSKKRQRQSKNASSSDIEAMSEAEEYYEISDVQSENKPSPAPTEILPHGNEVKHEDRDKETRRTKSKKGNSRLSAFAPENLTIEQMLERVRRMAQYVTRFEIEHAKKNCSGYDDEDNQISSIKLTSTKSGSTGPLITFVFTPSPSEHGMTPESFLVSSPIESNGMNSPPLTDSSDKESTSLIDQCEDLMRQITRFEQTYGDSSPEVEPFKKNLKVI
ncbi:hypothetical protein G9A89_019275 [Geosiphon pyriformis]|nr:hypothetical protein G9A89_019275 [Geosiphon pyriformis]